ncbi:MAG: carboxypeptidase regulatory-like domain-containing protein [Euryarchaeota archaeon]|nr:carboxypeptidase regulatory-like domain-containing protein [Euryarchaeota archaeon]
MTRRDGPTLAPLALVALLVLAGCAGPGAQGRPNALPGSPEPAAGRTASGTVVDDELRPLAGAVVSHLGGTASTSTGANGSFRLGSLPAANGLLLRAAQPGYRDQVVRVDLAYVASAEVRFVLAAQPTAVAHHLTNTTTGQVSCEAAAGNAHGFPGVYTVSCAEHLDNHQAEARVPFPAGALVGIVELAWEPQSALADILGLEVSLEGAGEPQSIAEAHGEPGDHYVRVHTGTSPFRALRGAGVLASHVHVEPGLLDDHATANAGAAVQQEFVLYTTTFYGELPLPTWTALAK